MKVNKHIVYKKFVVRFYTANMHRLLLRELGLVQLYKQSVNYCKFFDIDFY